MNNLEIHIENYLEYCSLQKRLDKKTLKAYQIDLRQFTANNSLQDISDLTVANLEQYIASVSFRYDVL